MVKFSRFCTTFWLSKIIRVTWNTSEIHSLKFDQYYIFLFAVEAKIRFPKRKLTD